MKSEEGKVVRISGPVRVEFSEFPSPPDILAPVVLGGNENKGITISEPSPQEMEDVNRLSKGVNPIAVYSGLISLWQDFYLRHLPNLGVSPKLADIMLQVKSFSDVSFISRPSNVSSLIIVDKDITIDRILKHLSGFVTLSPDLSNVAQIDDFFISDRPVGSQHYGIWMLEAMGHIVEDNQLNGLSWYDIARRKIKCSTLIEHLLAIVYLRHSPAWATLCDGFEDITLCAGSHTRRPIKLMEVTEKIFKKSSVGNCKNWIPCVHTQGDHIEISIVPPDSNYGLAHQVVSPYEDDFVGK